MKRSPYSKPYVKLREWLVKHRTDSKLTLRELSDILGVHHSIPGKIEKGGRKLDVIEYVQYCEAIGVDPIEGIEVVLASLKADAKS